MTRELIALLDGKEVGRVHRDARGRLTFVYDDEWRKAADSYPLSLSMPLGAKEHGRSVVEAFLWGLLPDNDRVLDRWAAKFQVSARNVFALISHVGEDCAGAVQFVMPKRLTAMQGGKDDKVEWLDDPTSPSVSKRCAQITPHGGCHETLASSALQVPNRRPPCFSKMIGGAFLLDVCRRRIF